MIKNLTFLSSSVLLSLSFCIFGCETQTDETASSSDQDEIMAGTEEPVAGSEEPVAGTEEPVAGTEEPVAGTEEPIAGEETDDTERPELPLGLEDNFSRQACQLFNLETTPITAVAERESAGQVLVLPSTTSAYSVRLPESGTGYIMLEVPDWSITVGLFTHFTQKASIEDANGNTEVVGPLSWNASCDDITDERTHFHSWGSYVIELIGEPNNDVDLVILKRQ